MSVAYPLYNSYSQRDALSDARWDGVARPYRAEDVEKLRGSVRVEHTLADRGAQKLWELLNTENP